MRQEEAFNILHGLPQATNMVKKWFPNEKILFMSEYDILKLIQDKFLPKNKKVKTMVILVRSFDMATYAEFDGKNSRTKETREMAYIYRLVEYNLSKDKQQYQYAYFYEDEKNMYIPFICEQEDNNLPLDTEHLKRFYNLMSDHVRTTGLNAYSGKPIILTKPYIECWLYRYDYDQFINLLDDKYKGCKYIRIIVINKEHSHLPFDTSVTYALAHLNHNSKTVRAKANEVLMHDSIRHFNLDITSFDLSTGTDKHVVKRNTPYLLFFSVSDRKYMVISEQYRQVCKYR